MYLHSFGANSMMPIELQKKLNNALIFLYLVLLLGNPLDDYKKIKKKQDYNLKRLMKRAYKIPFYRERFDRIGKTYVDFKTAEDLVSFPILTKEELRAWIVEELAKNPKKYEKWYIVTTSGSTGKPLKTMVTPRENAILAANWIRIGCRNGFHPLFDKTLALKDPELINKRGGRDSFIQSLGLMRRSVISFTSDGREIIEAINSEKPDYIYIHRSKLFQALMFAKQEGVSVHKPKLIAIIGEGIDQQAATLINGFFPKICFSSYGTMETGACTYTEKGSFDKHIVTRDTHIINLINEKGEIADKGKMLLTNLFIYGFPIINYDIEDGAELEKNDQAEFPFLVNIKGRLNDIMYFKDGSSVDYHSFYSIMERRNDILQFRVIQYDYFTLEIQLVKNRDMKSSKEDICREIEEQIRKLIKDQDVQYVFRWVKELLPDENGKRRFVVSNIKK